MALRINHNIASINGHRNLLQNDHMLGKSLEKLSSGLKINRAADGPASLIISEQLRAQTQSIKQAIANNETAVSMLQTSEAALTEVTNLLTNMRQLAIHASNEGANSPAMLEADQLELANSLETMDRITFQAQFGTKKLLDGSTGANGVASGPGLAFLEASPLTRASSVEGYEVRVFHKATRAEMHGETGLTQEMIDKGEQISISEGGRTVFFTTTKGDSAEQVFGKLRAEIKAQGLELDMHVEEGNKLSFVHHQYGSKYFFEAASSTAGFIGKNPGEMSRSVGGRDIEGTIGGQFATGEGQTLTGGSGTRVDGLKVLYTGEVETAKDASEGSPAAGRVSVYQNSLVFQIGPNAGQSASVSLINTNTRTLARGVINDAGYKALHDIDVRTTVGAQSALKLIERGMDEVNKTRAGLGAFQKNALEANLRQLRVNFTELTNSESVIRDADMAEEMTEFTRNNIMTQSAVAMLAQANQLPNHVLSLLK
ncbi:MAG TPA: flagellin [bacterium]